MDRKPRTVLVGTKTLLVPYLKYHVPQYHSWMSNPSILEATASERLSLEEEFVMQQSWWKDANKFTFIVLDAERVSSDEREAYCSIFKNAREGKIDEEKDEGGGLVSCDISVFESAVFSTDAMAGDVNVFVYEEDDSENMIGEIEIMIANTSCRRKGLAREAVVLMMNFARTHLGLLKFVAKIKADNDGSINMFKKLGYKETCFVECFNEYCFEFAFDGAAATTQSTAGAQAGVEGVVSPASVKEEAKEADMPILIGDVSLALSTLHLGPSSFSASSATLVSAGSLTRKDAEVILAHLLDRKAATQKEMLANLELNATRQTNDKVKAVLLKKLDVQRANIVWELAKEKERIMSDDRIRTLLT